MQTIKTPPTGVSTEDGALTPISWPYFTALDSFFTERHCINPPYVIDTSSIYCSSNTLDKSSHFLSPSPTPDMNVSYYYASSTYLPQSPADQPGPSLTIPASSQDSQARCILPTAQRKRPRRKEKEETEELLKYLKEQDEREQRNTDRLFAIMERLFSSPPKWITFSNRYVLISR